MNPVAYLAMLCILALVVAVLASWDTVKPRLMRSYGILVTYNIWPGSGLYPGRHRAA